MRYRFGLNFKEWKVNDSSNYVLVFAPVDGFWLEVGCMYDHYTNWTLAAFLYDVGIGSLPDGIQNFTVIQDDGRRIYYNTYGQFIRVCVDFKKF